MTLDFGAQPVPPRGLNVVNFPAAGVAPLFRSICERVDLPGLGHDNPDWVDYSQMPISTPDQQRIEEVLDGTDLQNKALLHVGVGNSLLASRFAARCAAIDGLTVSTAEQARAASLGLANYRVFRCSKYGVELLPTLGRRYDLIVDNNPASFACCEFHFLLMLTSYRALLLPGGCLLTDRQGLDWSVGGPHWRFSFNELSRLGRQFQMDVRSITPWVYALVRH